MDKDTGVLEDRGETKWEHHAVATAETKAAHALNSQPREPWENQFLFSKHLQLWQFAIDWMLLSSKFMH